MGKFLTERAAGLRQGGIRAFFDKAAGYSDVINLGIGEPDLDTCSRTASSPALAV